MAQYDWVIRTFHSIRPVVEEVLRLLIKVKVAQLNCKIPLLEVKVLHSKSYLSKSTKVSASNYTEKCK